MTAVTDEYKGSTVSVVFSGTQTLASLADNEWVNESDEITNPSGWVKGDIDLVLGSAAFPVATDNAMEIYVIPKLNDGTFADYRGGDATADEQENNQLFVGSITLSANTEAQNLTLPDATLPPGPFKVGARSRAGVALAASGNSIKIRYKAPTSQ
jgi:hypothetical protein